ncbi:hypothetical protein V7S43_007128 [Phytophthora oleae]|uniref:Uncharacterized protein n=1 Tax=Phytophthora oleae TaxID=2107226 RepID=A0ABD3FMM1_9STRA
MDQRRCLGGERDAAADTTEDGDEYRDDQSDVPDQRSQGRGDFYRGGDGCAMAWEGGSRDRRNGNQAVAAAALHSLKSRGIGEASTVLDIAEANDSSANEDDVLEHLDAAFCDGERLIGGASIVVAKFRRWRCS